MSAGPADDLGDLLSEISEISEIPQTESLKSPPDRIEMKHVDSSIPDSRETVRQARRRLPSSPARSNFVAHMSVDLSILALSL